MSLNKLNIQSVCSYFHIASTLFLFCTIPFFYTMFTQYGLILFFTSFVLDYIASKRWQQGFKLDKPRIISLFLLLQIVLLFVFSFFEQDTRYLSTFYEYRSILLAFGIVGLLGVSDKFKIRPFAYLSILSVLICIYYTIELLPEYYDRLVNINQKLNEIRNTRGLNISSHMMINTFLSVGMILFAKVISISKSKIEKAFCIIMIIVYYALIILSDGRIGMMNASIILFCIILRFAAVKLKYLVPTLIGMLSILCLGICFLLSDSPVKKDITVLKKNNPREYIWKDGVELIKESPIIAKGASTNALRVKEKLLNDEELKKIETFLIKRLNEDKVYAMHTHNQLMQSWQEYGLIGVFAIVALFVSIFLYAKSSLSMFILFSMISIQLMTDVIDGSVGNLGFSMYIYLMFILISSKQVGKEKISSPKEALSAPSNA